MKYAFKTALLLALVYFLFTLTIPLTYDAQFYVSKDYDDYAARLSAINASLNYSVPLASQEYYDNYPPLIPRITRFVYSTFGEFGFKLLMVIFCILLPFLALRQFGDAAALTFVALSGVPMLFISFTTLAQAYVTTIAINFYGAYHRLESWEWKILAFLWYGWLAFVTHSTGLILIGGILALVELKRLLERKEVYSAMIYSFGAYKVVTTAIITAAVAGLAPIYCAFKGKKHKILAVFLMLSIAGAAYDIRVAWTGYALACINAPESILKWKYFYPAIILNLLAQLAFGWSIA